MSDKSNPFDFSQFFQFGDPAKMQELFGPEAFKNWFSNFGAPGMDPTKLFSDHREQFEALTKANVDAWEAYKTQAERQKEIFDQIMAAAKENMEKFDLSGGPNSASQNMKAYSEALGTAMNLMEQLTAETREATEQAYQRVSEQVQDAISALNKPTG